MYRIAIFDGQYVQETYKQALEQLEIEHCVTAFYDSVNFIDAFTINNEIYDLAIINIPSENKVAVEAAHLLRRENGQISIILISDTLKYATCGYDIKALHYLVKPLCQECLTRLISEDYKNKVANTFFVFEQAGIRLKVHVDDIICMETAGRRVGVTLKNGKVYYSGKLAKLLEKLPPERFIRCHQSFAINLSNIERLTQKEAMAYSGKLIPISRSYIKEVRKAFMGYAWH